MTSRRAPPSDPRPQPRSASASSVQEPSVSAYRRSSPALTRPSSVPRSAPGFGFDSEGPTQRCSCHEPEGLPLIEVLLEDDRPPAVTHLLVEGHCRTATVRPDLHQRRPELPPPVLDALDEGAADACSPVCSLHHQDVDLHVPSCRIPDDVAPRVALGFVVRRRDEANRCAVRFRNPDEASGSLLRLDELLTIAMPSSWSSGSGGRKTRLSSSE